MPATDAPERRLLLRDDLRRGFRYATERNPDLRTRGGKIGVLARSLGRPLRPHQQFIADVATEINPPGSRLFFRYQRIIIAEPRQVGKTVLLRPVMLDRCLTWPGTDVFMTAQTGKDGGERWDDLVGDLQTSPFGRFLEVKRGKGSQVARFPNASTIAPFAPTRDGLHGESPDLVGIDEAWSFSQDGGLDVMRAVRPAQITRTRRQLWILSAAGTADSEWWNELVEVGRASVDDPSSTTAYFEHSMDPDADPYDPASWEFHPGLDGLITVDDLAEEAKPENNTHADFLRGFMNISTKVRDKTVIDLDEWTLRAAPQSPPTPDTVVTYAYDLALDRTTATIYAAWPAPDGKTDLKILRTGEHGEAWLADAAANVYREHGQPLHTWDGGPARQVTDALQRDGIPVETVTGTERSTAWVAFKAAVNAKQIRHDAAPALRAALEIAVEIDTDDETRPSRRRSLGPIDPLLSAATARWFSDRATPAVQIF